MGWNRLRHRQTLKFPILLHTARRRVAFYSPEKGEKRMSGYGCLEMGPSGEVALSETTGLPALPFRSEAPRRLKILLRKIWQAQEAWSQEEEELPTNTIARSPSRAQAHLCLQSFRPALTSFFLNKSRQPELTRHLYYGK